MRWFLFAVFVSAAAANRLECRSDQTKIQSWFSYESLGRSCAVLISSITDTYHNDFIHDCKRWMGETHQDYVSDYYVTSCEALPNGTLKYQADICCEGSGDMRCFECTEFTDDAYCVQYASANECDNGMVCGTAVEYTENYPDTMVTRSTSCMEAATCQAAHDDNNNTCVDWILQPTCTYCCDMSFCNYNPPDGPFLFVGNDPCSSAPCYNGGTCLRDDPPSTTYTCQCADNYDGPYCSIFTADPCLLTPCHHDGVCESSGTIYTCTCRLGWGGDNCDDEYPECLDGDDFCENGGTCIDHGEYGRRCRCPPQFIGTHCELEHITCTNPAAYRIGASSRKLDWDCSSHILDIQQRRDYESGLYWCTHYMKQPGKPLFQNTIHGEVNEVEVRSYHACNTGELYTFFTNSWCCPSCHSMPCANGGWCTQAADHDYICKCRQGWYGRNCDLKKNICLISGDPHYETFDKAIIHFQGGVQYELSSSTDPLEEPFFVAGTNERVGAVSYLYSLEVSVCGHVVVLGREHSVTVDGEKINPADGYEVDCIRIMMNGHFVRCETDFNLVVEYDGVWTGLVQVPPSFSGKVQGLCGNFDGYKDTDYIDRNGTDHVDSPLRDPLTGIGWQIGDNDGITLPEPVLDCSDIEETIDSPEYCGLLLDHTGPFAACLADPNVVSGNDLENCRYDVCANSPNQPGMKFAACSTLAAFVLKCEAAGHMILWREEVDCPLNCPDGRVYKESTSACPATCRQPDAAKSCPLPNTESCVCPEGSILDHGICIPPQDCGCIDEYGNKFEVGDSWLSSECDRRTCVVCTSCDIALGEIIEEAEGCAKNERCQETPSSGGECVVACEVGFEYQKRGSVCPASCLDPDAPSTCELPDQEVCVCPEGKLLHDGACVNPRDCGCVGPDGNLFSVGEEWERTCIIGYVCELCDTCSSPETKEQARSCCAGPQCMGQPIQSTPAPTMGSAVTIFDGELITSETEQLTVVTGVDYSVSTTMIHKASRSNINLFKLLDGSPQSYRCDNENKCASSVRFTVADLSVGSVFVGSTVETEAGLEEILVACNVQLGSTAVMTTPTALTMLLLALVATIVGRLM